MIHGKIKDLGFSDTVRISFVAHIELEFVPREEKDRSSVYGQEQPGVSVPWADEARSFICFRFKKSPRKFPGKTMEAFLCRVFPTRGGSLHGGSEEDALDNPMRLPPQRIDE